MPSSHRFTVAPMIDWTDRHCRYFHRQLTKRARLYTEMIVADAILRGDKDYLLGFDEAEHPVALQLGGSDQAKLAQAAIIGADYGYDEINLNVGCPSDRVQSGTFGACLMKTPEIVVDGVNAMQSAVSIPVTVKCRIGVDDQNPEEVLPEFVHLLETAGVETLIIHARKAWLNGLSPKENRTIPPLDYPLVYRIKQSHPDMQIILNGGVVTIEESQAHLNHVDGVMMGRAAYETPWLLSKVDNQIFGEIAAETITRQQVVETMVVYLEKLVAQNVRPHALTRHMIGLFHGCQGARLWRQHLSTQASKPGAGAEVLLEALKKLPAAAFEEAA